MTIRHVAPGAEPASRAVIDGGFDPIGVTAQTGDLLFATVTREGTASRVDTLVVPANTDAHIVRIAPADQKTNVPVGAHVIEVISQPVDWSTFKIQLSHDSVDVSGTIQAITGGGDTLIAEFVPASALEPNTTYRIVVFPPGLDRNGPREQSFTTGSIVTPPRDAPPTVRITSPSGGETFTPDYVALTVAASDDKSIDSLYLNLVAGPGVGSPRVVYAREWVGQEARVSMPVSWPGSKLAFGTYTWQAAATDRNGHRTESAPVTVTLAPPEPNQLIVVDTASLIEFTRGTSGFLYAPQLKVTVLPGAGTLQVRDYQLLALDGSAEMEVWCNSGSLPEGQGQDVISSRARHYDVTSYFYDLVESLAGKTATAMLVYRDEQGRNYVLDLNMPIVAETTLPRTSGRGTAPLCAWKIPFR